MKVWRLGDCVNFVGNGHQCLTCMETYNAPIDVKKGFFLVFNMYYFFKGWLRGTAVERRSLAGELSLSCLDL